MRKIGLLSAATMALGMGIVGAMRSFDAELPAFSGYAPAYATASLAMRRDGLGRRVKPKNHPTHNAHRRMGAAFAEFRKRVEATHSDRPDPRHDKYLHSHARQLRSMRLAA